MTLPPESLHSSGNAVALEVPASAESAPDHGYNRSGSLPLHLVVSLRLMTPQSSAAHCSLCTLSPFFPDHALSTVSSVSQMTTAFVTVPIEPLVQRLSEPAKSPRLVLLPLLLSLVVQ